MKNVFLFAVILGVISCGDSSDDQGGSQEHLIPTSIKQEGILGSWKLQDDEVSFDLYRYVEATKLTAVTKCFFTDHDPIYAVVSSPIIIEKETGNANLANIRVLKDVVSKVKVGNDWCYAALEREVIKSELLTEDQINFWGTDLITHSANRLL